jgi:hypothetical protein
MDQVLQAQFARVESALNTLVDSIASFNPSHQAALDVVAADDELRSGLDQCRLPLPVYIDKADEDPVSEHQANHARILALRIEADALETQLKSSVRTLATLRHELFNTPATAFSNTARPVPFDELLQYADAISKYTVPPTYREPVPKSGSGIPSNGMNTPAVSNALAATADDARKDGEADAAAQHQVTPEQAEWLKKLHDGRIAWVPYPDNDKIRRGNLMAIQYLLDQKKDPWTEKVPNQQELEDELEKQKEAEDQSQAQIQAAAEQLLPLRKESMFPAPREQQSVSQFKGFDFDDDDD